MVTLGKDEMKKYKTEGYRAEKYRTEKHEMEQAQGVMPLARSSEPRSKV
jgi:hypothetical protein